MIYLDMKKTILLLSIIITLLVVLHGNLFADEIHFEASVNRNIISLGHRLQLSLKFEGSKNIPAPGLPEIEGFKSRYMGPSTRMSIVNGKMSSSVTHIYSLMSLKTGTFTVGPISFEHNNNSYVSNALTVKVADNASGRPPAAHPEKQQQASLKDRLFITMEAGKSRSYINEQILLTIKLYVSGLSVRNINYPEFRHDGFSAEQFGKPKQYQERKKGIIYDVVEFSTTIFSIKAGNFTLGPTKLGANILMTGQRSRSSPLDNFFGRYESEPVELRSEETAITVLPLPAKNRPEGFNGAVGTFMIDSKVSPSEVRAGDPVTLKTTVTGKGNFGTVTAPVLKNPEGFKTYEPQAKQEDSSKTFEQILIPISDSVAEVPAVIFSYFDTSAGAYRTLSRGPFPIHVTKPDKKEALTIMEAPRLSQKTYIKENLGRDIIYIKESPGSMKNKGSYLYRTPLFLLMQVIPVLLFTLIMTLKKRRDRLSTDIGYARRLKAPRRAGKGIKEAEQYLHNNMTRDFYDSVFRTLREYIGNRFHMATGGITVDDVEHVLKDRNIEASVMERIKNIFTECDMARYAPAELGVEKRENTLKELKETIDFLERNK
jgi:hypothetical protein